MKNLMFMVLAVMICDCHLRPANQESGELMLADEETVVTKDLIFPDFPEVESEQPPDHKTEMVIKNQSIALRAGSTVSFHCPTEGYTQPKIIWSMIDNDMNEEVVGLQSVLELTNVTPMDSGNYTCTIMDDDDQISFTYSLQVTDSADAPPIIKAPENATVVIGENTSFSCMTEIPAKTTWYNPQGIEIQVANSEEVVIYNATPSDSGWYTCVADTAFGMYSKEAYLLVVDKDGISTVTDGAVSPQSGFYCLLPPAPGPCKDNHTRYFFAPSTRRCTEFIYGGCFGNENNFASADDCVNVCGKSESSQEDTKNDLNLRKNVKSTTVATEKSSTEPSNRASESTEDVATTTFFSTKTDAHSTIRTTTVTTMKTRTRSPQRETTDDSTTGAAEPKKKCSLKCKIKKAWETAKEKAVKIGNKIKKAFQKLEDDF